MGVGQDRVWSIVENEYGGRVDEDLLTRHVKRQCRKITGTGESGKGVE